MKLENGSRVMCDATSSAAIRGGSFNFLLLDEYAFLPSHIAEEFYASTYPTISAGTTTKLVIVSTPNGLNHFHKLWIDANRVDGHKQKNKFIPVEVIIYIRATKKLQIKFLICVIKLICCKIYNGRSFYTLYCNHFCLH